MENDKTLIWEGITIFSLLSEWYLYVHFKQRVSMTYSYLVRSTRYPQQVYVSPLHGNQVIVTSASILIDYTMIHLQIGFQICVKQFLIIKSVRDKTQMKRSVLRSKNSGCLENFEEALLEINMFSP